MYYGISVEIDVDFGLRLPSHEKPIDFTILKFESWLAIAIVENIRRW